MIPIGDVNPRQRFPIVTASIILLNALVFLYQVTLPDDELASFVLQAGMVPYEVTQLPSGGAIVSLLTSMFLHGGWLHIIGNMLYLWIFGDNIEEALGPLPFILFYLSAGVIAALSQIAVDPTSRIPTIGASGAIAGVLGAYLVVFPKARVRTLIFLVRIVRVIQLPAIVVLGFWFVLQLFSGVVSIGVTTTGGGVAWFAHIGGFVAGLAVGLFLRGRIRPSRARYS